MGQSSKAARAGRRCRPRRNRTGGRRRPPRRVCAGGRVVAGAAPGRHRARRRTPRGAGPARDDAPAPSGSAGRTHRSRRATARAGVPWQLGQRHPLGQRPRPARGADARCLLVRPVPAAAAALRLDPVRCRSRQRERVGRRRPRGLACRRSGRRGVPPLCRRSGRWLRRLYGAGPAGAAAGLAADRALSERDRKAARAGRIRARQRRVEPVCGLCRPASGPQRRGPGRDAVELSLFHRPSHLVLPARRGRIDRGDGPRPARGCQRRLRPVLSRAGGDVSLSLLPISPEPLCRPQPRDAVLSGRVPDPGPATGPRAAGHLAGRPAGHAGRSGARRAQAVRLEAAQCRIVLDRADRALVPTRRASPLYLALLAEPGGRNRAAAGSGAG